MATQIEATHIIYSSAMKHTDETISADLDWVEQATILLADEK